MNVRLYRFTKRFNSTKVPDLDSDSNYSLHSGELKENTSIVNPVIRFRINDSAVRFGGDDTLGPPVRYNYAWINQFKRFYWIKDWVWEGPYWVAYLSEDLLGSWKSAIGSTEQYIERCADSTNGTIIDAMYPATSEISIESNSATNPFSWSSDYSGLRYIMTAVGSGLHLPYVASQRYVLTGTELSEIMSELIGTTINFQEETGNMYGITEAVLEIAGLTSESWKTLFNPLQYIQSLFWYPFELDSVTSGRFGVGVGWWEVLDSDTGLTKSCYTLGDFYKDFSISLTVPKHPLASSRGVYLNTSAYSSYQLIFMPFGSFDLPADLLWNSTSITCSVRVELITGRAFLRIMPNNTNQPIATAEANIGIQLKLSQITQDLFGAGISVATSALSSYSNTLSGILSGASSAALGTLAANPAAALGSIATPLSNWGEGTAQRYLGEYDGMTKAFPTVSIKGSDAGSCNVYTSPTLVGRFKDLVDKDWADSGRPYCSKDTISNHNGYILCQDVDLSNFSKTVTVDADEDTTAVLHANASELSEIKNIMEKGFFYQ